MPVEQRGVLGSQPAAASAHAGGQSATAAGGNPVAASPPSPVLGKSVYRTRVGAVSNTFETPAAGGDARHTPPTGSSMGTVTGALESLVPHTHTHTHARAFSLSLSFTD